MEVPIDHAIRSNPPGLGISMPCLPDFLKLLIQLPIDMLGILHQARPDSHLPDICSVPESSSPTLGSRVDSSRPFLYHRIVGGGSPDE